MNRRSAESFDRSATGCAMPRNGEGLSIGDLQGRCAGQFRGIQDMPVMGSRIRRKRDEKTIGMAGRLFLCGAVAKPSGIRNPWSGAAGGFLQSQLVERGCLTGRRLDECCLGGRFECRSGLETGAMGEESRKPECQQKNESDLFDAAHVQESSWLWTDFNRRMMVHRYRLSPIPPPRHASSVH